MTMKQRPFRATDEEWQAILDTAKKLKISAAEFLRMAARREVKKWQS